MSKIKAKNGTVKEIINRIMRYKGRLVAALLLAAASVALTMYLPILIGQAIDCIISAGNVNFDRLIYLLVKSGVLALLTGIFTWIMNILYNNIAFNVVRDIRRDAIAKIEVLPLSYVDSHSTGDLISRVISDVDQFSDGLIMGFAQLFTGVLTIVLTLVFMLMISPLITIVVALITPLSLFVAKFISKKIFRMFQLQAKTRGEQTAFIDEMINNQKTVAAYSQEEKNVETFCEINERLRKYSLKATFFSS
ncbi:MAG: ABC transporter ATP-binding protein, partial [Acutalibacteraceae bacterium]|nr:ABC transporter ATP-binding protein [Acutalibacteraceae bacterium]